MQKEDVERFNEAIQATAEVYGQRLSASALKIWWQVLKPYTLEQVWQALSHHVTASVYAPKPADVVSYIQQGDGRPDPEEAWSIALEAADENATVVWTDEIAEAKSAADTALANRDRVGARMAFLETYRSLINKARERHEPPRWWLSPGQDPERRAEAVREAYEKERITQEKAEKLLPERVEEIRGGEQPALSAGEVQSHIEEVRAALAPPETEEEPPPPPVSEGAEGDIARGADDGG